MSVQCRCGNKYVETPEGLEDYQRHVESCPVTGVCCSCQSRQPLQWTKHLGFPYVVTCQQHLFPGTSEWCDGSDTAPQVVFNEQGKHIQSWNPHEDDDKE